MSDIDESNKSQSQQDDSFPTISSAPSAKAIGSKIGPYKLLSVLGEGGFGMVYLAEQYEPVRRRVALKVIKPGMDTRQVIARFEAERQALALLDHPNIAHVFDAGTTDAGRPYFAMELVKGLPITEHCDQHKLGIEERLELFQQVCDAVQHAHQKGIIHRDLKPSNILVPTRGGKPVPVIVDFGVAKAVSQPLTERTLYTEQGQFVGTPEYMSPEQAGITIEDIDTRSDVYSLGVILYELLTGTLPFTRDELKVAGFAEIQRIIREVDPPRPSTRLSSLGEKAKAIAEKRCTELATLTKRMYKELEWIPLKAMRKEPDRRYQSASELAQDVRNYIKGDPLLAGPESATYRLKKAIKRNRALVTGIAAVLLVLIAGIIVSTVFAFGAVKAQKATEQALEEAEQAKQLSEEQKENAELAREEAVKAKDLADVARAEAEQAKKEAEERAEELRIASYYGNIRLADNELSKGRFYSASRYLDNCPRDLLGWEWYYLDQIIKSTGILHQGSGYPLSSGRIISNGHIVFHKNNKALIIWDVETSSESFALSGHEARITSASLSRDGDKVVSGDSEGVIKVWNALTGSCITTITTYDEESEPIQLNSTGKSLSDTSIPEVNLNIPEELKVCTENLEKIYAAIKKYEKEKGKLPDWLSDLVPDYLSKEDLLSPAHPVQTKALYTPDPNLPCSYEYEFSPTRNQLSGGKLYREWKEQQVSTFGDVVPIIRCLYHDPGDYSMALNVSVGGQIYWSPWGWESMFRPRNYNVIRQRMAKRIRSVALSPDGKRVLSNNWAGALILWDVATGKEILTINDRIRAAESLSFSPDGERFLAVDSLSIRIWNIKGEELLNLPIEAWVAVWSSDGQRIIYRTYESSIGICEAETGKNLKKFPANFDADTLAISPDNKYIVSGDFNGTIKVWDLESGTEELVIRGHECGIPSITFSNNGKKIISVDDNGMIGIWRFPSRSSVQARTIMGRQPSFQATTFSLDRKQITAVSQDKLNIFNIAEASEIRTFDIDGLSYGISITSNADGKYIAIGNRMPGGEL